MPSQKTASKEKTEVKPAQMVKVEVLQAIGLPATKEDIKQAKMRSDRKGIAFTDEGFTTMIYPNKPKQSADKKTMIPGDPVFVEVDIDIARKWQNAGVVRVVI